MFYCTVYIYFSNTVRRLLACLGHLHHYKLQLVDWQNHLMETWKMKREKSPNLLIKQNSVILLNRIGGYKEINFEIKLQVCIYDVQGTEEKRRLHFGIVIRYLYDPYYKILSEHKQDKIQWNKRIYIPAPIEAPSTGTRISLVVTCVVTITTTIVVTTVSCMSATIIVLIAERNT